MDYCYSAGRNFDIGYVADTVSETFAYQLHSHEGIYEILYMEEGDASFWVEGTIYKMSPGDIAITRNDEMHLMRHHSPTVYKRMVINVNFDYFEENECLTYRNVFDNRKVGTGNHFPADIVKQSGLYDTLQRLKYYLEKNEKPLIKAYLTEILYILNKMPERDTADSGIIRDIVLYINSNITQDLSLEKISGSFYISKYYLCREFKKRIGMSIGKYITHKRIMLVRDLYSTGKTLTEACISSGFGDYSSFYVAYKKLYGNSPKNINRE